MRRAVYTPALAILLAPVLALASGAHAPAPARSVEAILADLKAGNARFVKGQATHPRASLKRVKELATVQHPEAVVLGCSDSRVPPELLFDAGLGDLFVVRVAGNVVEEHTLGSVEYAAEHLGVPLVVILGHHGCGAVKACAEAHGPVEGNVGALVREIQPAVEEARKHSPADGLVHDAVHRHAVNQAAAVTAESPVLRALVAEGRVKVVTAVYDLETGAVDWAN